MSAPFQAFISQISSVVIPKNVQKALNVPKWREVIAEEIRALEKNATWEVTELPKGKDMVGCNCVYCEYKGCLVAKGHTPYGVDYS